MRSVVRTRQGLLEGFDEGGLHKFYGVPYAEPPIGELRWRAPRPPSMWDGVRGARAFGPACPQTVGAVFDLRTGEQSEDCLYLNVWTRTLDASARQPVMVWLHGGGNLGGAGSEDAYDGSRLAAEGVTVVTFNYRLGAFGFLAHPAVGANFGVLDQVALLRWVKENISAFGGSADNVTIFGQSAGAVAVRSLLSCPHAFGLFHRGVLQSAGFEPPAFAPPWSYARAQSAAESLFQRLGGGEPATWRRAPTEAVKLASHELSGVFPKPGHVHTPANLVWMPVADGVTLVGDGFPGWPADVPVMLGCLENEARYFIKPGGSYSRAVVENMAKALCGPKADEVMALFDAEQAEPYEALDRVFTTAIWTEPAMATVDRFAALGQRLYYYHFARPSPGAIATNELVKHSAEIRYVFGTLTNEGAYDDRDRLVSDLMRQAWIAFARNGVPESAGVAWPQFDRDDPKAAVIVDDAEGRAFPVTDLMKLIHSTRTV